ncbi:putative uncharacterized protein [Carnobacterium maltaromaticum LMA28]|uniref:Glycosyltransferase 2-like domain-containing protein n=2 Tax=Carnobacterium maltaromaticum TaxID=2751 RepID=K8E5Q5_CARML|nr:glycosyltransferase [Carnobacterium maltaromaticum]CCO12014.2 putative uncharacterized protein [Carnobacterium maltaromaticum LMA28]
MNNIAIVIVTFNRENSLIRLLNSLKKANYGEDVVDLIISIDNSGENNVYETSKQYDWPFGEKKIIKHMERQGLKKHVLGVGELTHEYENIIVLEDDIYVSPNFYMYSKEAAIFFKDDKNIAGISLYNFEMNPNLNIPFSNAKNGYDNYFIQFAQSWGQIWSRENWNSFSTWLEFNNIFNYSEGIPPNIMEWSEKSWLKYHIKYCVDNKKYFVYPNCSLSTNFGDVGEHSDLVNPLYQTNLLYEKSKNYNFCSFSSHDAVIYDAYFERVLKDEHISVDVKKLCVDLYGQKKNKENKRYWLTKEKKDYKKIKSYKLALRPHEMNIIEDITGEDIYLYDCNTNEKNIRKANKNYFLYYFKILDRRIANKIQRNIYARLILNKIRKRGK